MGCLNDGGLLLEHQTWQPKSKSFTPVTKKKVLTKTFQFFYGIKHWHLRELLPLLNQKPILLFSCVCIFLMCSKNKQDRCILYFELFLCIKMVQKACYCLEKTPFQILFLVPLLSFCKVAWLKLHMFIVCFVNGSIYSCNKVNWSSKCGRNSS